MNSLPNELIDKVKDYIIFKPESYEEIREAVENWVIDNEDALEEYGHISTWDTSLIKNMSSLFYFDDSNIPFFEQYDEKYLSINLFNDDISNWDVSNVIDMSNMFSNCIEFNQPLNKWNVSKVKNMSYMFYKAHHFNQNLNEWDLSDVKCEKIFTNSGITEENKPKLA